MAAQKKNEENEVVYPDQEEAAPAGAIPAQVMPSSMGATFAERAKANGRNKRIESGEKK